MSTIDMFRVMRDPTFCSNPHPHLRQLRESDPVHRSPRTGIWFLTRHADCVKHARSPKLGRDLRLWDSPGNMRRPENAQYDPLTYELFTSLQHQMFHSNPPTHTRQRRVFQHAFLPAAVRQMEEVVQATADRLIAELPDGEIKLMDRFAEPFPVAVICGLFELPVDQTKTLKAWSDGMAPLTEMGMTLDQKIASFKAYKEFCAYIEQLVDQRRQKPGNGLIDHVIAAESEEGALSSEELINNIVSMLFAGHETATNLIGSAMLCLLKYPEQYARLRADPSLVPSAIEEVLRFEPPANTNARVAIEDVEIGGKLIPKGSLCLGMLASANRDPEVFERPDEFDITRTHNPHQTFGGGIHHCIGASLGRLEGRIALAGLLRRYSQIELAEEPVWRKRINIRGVSELVLRAKA